MSDSYTDTLNLTKPERAASDWDTKYNNNFDKIDNAYADLASAITDAPEGYEFTGNLASAGTTHTLPKTVSATNEYTVHITLTADPGADAGRIYVSKGTSSFVVYDPANSGSGYEAVVYYLTDTNVYGASWHRRWFVSPDTSITDHADTAVSGSLA